MSVTQSHQAKNLIKELGGAKQVHGEIVEYSKRVVRFEEMRNALMKKHPDKWVAMADEEIVTVAESLQDALDELDRRGIRRADAVVEFLNTRPRNMIL